MEDGKCIPCLRNQDLVPTAGRRSWSKGEIPLPCGSSQARGVWQSPTDQTNHTLTDECGDRVKKDRTAKRLERSTVGPVYPLIPLEGSGILCLHVDS